MDDELKLAKTAVDRMDAAAFSTLAAVIERVEDVNGVAPPRIPVTFDASATPQTVATSSVLAITLALLVVAMSNDHW